MSIQFMWFSSIYYSLCIIQTFFFLVMFRDFTGIDLQYLLRTEETVVQVFCLII